MQAFNIFLTIALFAISTLSQAQDIKPLEVKQVMKKVADWQIEHFQDVYPKNKEPHHPLDWENGAFYVGMVKWAAIADSDKYYNWLKEIGDKHEWKLNDRQYHADDHAVGQMYLELYREYGDENMIKPTKEQFDFIAYHPAQTAFKWHTPFHRDRWNWCDALFMAPPVWAKLYNVTNDKKYLNFLMAEYKVTVDSLFDKKEKLFYRDERFIGQRDNGTKIFWARGNGWVFGGLPIIMDELDPKSREYKYFLKIYKKMAAKLTEIQTPEGHWAMSLLGQKFYPTPETSGTSFFAYGLAWGINQGILDKEKYEPVVAKAWKALVSYVADEGYLGYVQPVGAAPGEAWADKSEVFGTGAFLSAGSEIYKLYGGH